MPITLSADRSRRFMVATAVGDLARADLQEFRDSVRNGPYRDWPLLFDATAASTDISAEQVSLLASEAGSAFRAEGSRSPAALVATNTVLFGMMRMYQTLCEERGFDGIGVFRTREDAEIWLSQRVAGERQG
jgi:hypothetical protein